MKSPEIAKTSRGTPIILLYYNLGYSPLDCMGTNIITS